jgi:SAM-dependent methyltransferase
VSVDPDEENVALAMSRTTVDELLGDFYGAYPWPWQPTTFSYVDDPRFEATMTSQDIGDWEHNRLPENPAIWVAGCGTNQALQSALKFPHGTVTGSDVSVPSLDLAQANAAKVGIANLTLRQESINQVEYREQFDYIISTGVIHHNAEPQTTLRQLSAALKPDGILELMVYNRFHRMLNSSFQKAIRIFGEQQGTLSFESDFQLARTVASNFPVRNQMAQLLEENRSVPDAEFADRLIHPIEHSYTVESLEALAASCGLEILMPCISTFAKFQSPAIDWNMRFESRELQRAYDSMPDTRRWQVSNLLLHEQSPLLWFYFQRTACGRARKSEQQICDEFLEHAFKKSVAKQRTYIRNGDEWALAPQAVPYPFEQPEAALDEIYRLADGDNTMGRILKYVGIESTFQTVNQTRIKLTTSSFPYLKAVK